MSATTTQGSMWFDAMHFSTLFHPKYQDLLVGMPNLSNVIESSIGSSARHVTWTTGARSGPVLHVFRQMHSSESWFLITL